MEFITEYLTLFNVVGVLTGALIGGLINLTGVGGGVLIIPILSVGFGLSPVVAVGTASIYATLTKLVSSASHIRSGRVNWQVVMAFLAGAIPVTLGISSGVVYILESIPQHQALVQQTVKIVIIVVMTLSAISMLWQTQQPKSIPMKRAYLVLAGGLTGLIMGLTGIGGGVLIIPLLVWLTQESIKGIVSCSIIIAFIISALSGLIYSQGGQYHLVLLIGLLIGSVVGIKVSDWFKEALSEDRLKKMVIVLIFISAIAMLFRD